MPESKCPLLSIVLVGGLGKAGLAPCVGNECAWWVIPDPAKDSRASGCALVLLAKGEEK